ncbi:MAG TPA: aminotransferase [Candidatus Moranbacteria bacterium]|nr:MAG: DegT/DnrJ/EryC1/StrS aminotransferase [Candidatus Moranbacteria bacterium GW2011_GWF1_34_10]HBI16896.1 aminotransferase [Candidatus Moranbacteria bacterium]
MLKNKLIFEKPVLITKPVMVDLTELNHELREVWNSGWLTNNGYKHQELEVRLRNEIFNNFATSLVVNATIGLLIALKTLDIKGEVITTPFTFPATAHAISWAGLKPIFCDIDPVTMNIDSEKIESLITDRTSAIVGVHVFGNPCDVEKIDKIAKKYNLKVIYDAAHAFELEINDRSIVNYGDASVFSFHATKLFHTAEGGAIVFKEKSMKGKCDIIKNFGIKGDDVVECGINGKMNELQAAVGLLMLKEKEEERELRKLIEGIYMKELSGVDGVILPNREKKVTKNSLQYFVIRVDADKFGKTRDDVFEELRKNNVFARKYFYPLCTEYNHYSCKNIDIKNAEKIVEQVLCLPFHGGLSIKDATAITKIIKNISKK